MTPTGPSIKDNNEETNGWGKPTAPVDWAQVEYDESIDIIQNMILNIDKSTVLDDPSFLKPLYVKKPNAKKQ